MNRCFISTIAVAIAILMFSPAVSATMLDAETGELTGDCLSYPNYFEYTIQFVEDSTLEISQEEPAIMLLSEDAENDEDYLFNVNKNDYYGRYALSLKGEKAEFFVKLYDALDAALKGKELDVDISDSNWNVSTLTANLSSIIAACENDTPQYFYKDIINYHISYSYYKDKDKNIYPKLVKFVPTIDSTEVSDEKWEEFEENGELLEEAAEKVIENSGITSDMCDYEKATRLHDEIAYMVEYDYDAAAEIMAAQGDLEKEAAAKKYPYVHTAYGALVEKKAVCDGYSSAYQYLLYKVGILSHIATGWGTDSNGTYQAHAWNLVKLDGDWYYTDLTWDDQTSGLFHSYYNITAEMLEKDHSINESYYALPECTSTQDNYFEKNNFSLDADNIASQFKENITAHIYAPDATKDTIINEIRTALSLFGYVGGFSYYKAGDEYITFLLNSSNKINADKEFSMSVNINTPGTYRLMQIYYDNNDVMQKMVTKELEFTANNTVKLVTLHPTSDVKDYKNVKYFLWDEGGTVKPIAEMDLVKY